MPATVTLSTATLNGPLTRDANEVLLSSTSGVSVGKCLYIEGELMRVIGMLVDPWVQVIRGVDGTRGARHSSNAVVYIGSPDQFYFKDPEGTPTTNIPVSPHINVKTGVIWFAQGDTMPDQNAVRWWQAQAPTRVQGPLGVQQVTYDPSSST